MRATSQQWPAERFYWAVLEAPGVKAGVLPAGLEPALQEELPVSADQVHAVATPMDDGRLLVCAAPKDQLQLLGPEVLTLCASHCPSFVPEIAITPELLIGPYEPRALRRERGKRSLLLAASILLSASFMAVGLLRRAAALDDQAAAALAARETLLKQATAQGTSLSLDRELDQFRTSGRPAKFLTPHDAAETLANLLSRWPTDVIAEASSVSINQDSISLGFTMTEDARPLLAAIQAPDGWRSEEPRMTTRGGATRVSMTFRRAEGGRP